MQAEQLYGVRNTVASDGVEGDYLPLSISSANTKAWLQLKQNGLQPYLLPTATENHSACKDNCQSFLCPRQFQDKLIFASIVEDLPNKNNRIDFQGGQAELS